MDEEKQKPQYKTEAAISRNAAKKMLNEAHELHREERNARKSAHKDPSIPKSGKGRGAPKGNQNHRKSGIYTSLDSFTTRFKTYSQSFGRIDAREEVTLTRAMLVNLLNGKTPMGDGIVDDPETLTEYTRDLVMLNLKAQEIALKQQVKREEAEARAEGKKGQQIVLSNEFGDAIQGIVNEPPAMEEQLSQDADAVLEAAKEALRKRDEDRKEK